jgi:hypothetical protein
MYKASTPSITWAEIKKKYSDTGEIFYDKYSLSEQDYDRIKDKYSKKLNTFYRRKLDWFLLDYAPKSI